MIYAQESKVVLAIAPKGGTFTATEIDTLGYGYAQIVVAIGNADPGSITTLKVQETDTTGSGYADVAGAVYGTSTNIAGNTSSLPSGASDNTVYGFELNLAAQRKRFLKVVASGGGTTGTIVSAVAILSRAAQAPVTASDRGFADILRV